MTADFGARLPNPFLSGMLKLGNLVDLYPDHVALSCIIFQLTLLRS